jgi:hypothetical protein
MANATREGGDGRRAYFVELCLQFFSVFEMGIVANKKADNEIKLNCHHKRKIIFTMHLMTHRGRSQNRRGPIRSKGISRCFETRIRL